MKYVLTAIVFCFCFAGMANVDTATEKQSTSIEAGTYIDGGKKSRRTNRIKAKRKRKCQQAARRNFAG